MCIDLGKGDGGSGNRRGGLGGGLRVGTAGDRGTEFKRSGSNEDNDENYNYADANQERSYNPGGEFSFGHWFKYRGL